MSDYDTIALTVTSPRQSFTEPLAIDEVQEFLKLPERSTPNLAEEATLNAFIIGARVEAERQQNRDLVVKQYDLVSDYFPCKALRTPLISVDLVRYRNSEGAYTDLVADTEYITDLARGLIMPAYGESWPSYTAWPSSSVLVRFRSGMTADDPFWSDTGALVKLGMRQLISHWYTQRLPFEPSAIEIQEYPLTVALLSIGAVPRV